MSLCTILSFEIVSGCLFWFKYIHMRFLGVDKFVCSHFSTFQRRNIRWLLVVARMWQLEALLANRPKNETATNPCRNHRPVPVVPGHAVGGSTSRVTRPDSHPRRLGSQNIIGAQPAASETAGHSNRAGQPGRRATDMAGSSGRSDKMVDRARGQDREKRGQSDQARNARGGKQKVRQGMAQIRHNAGGMVVRSQRG